MTNSHKSPQARGRSSNFYTSLSPGSRPLSTTLLIEKCDILRRQMSKVVVTEHGQSLPNAVKRLIQLHPCQISSQRRTQSDSIPASVHRVLFWTHRCRVTSTNFYGSHYSHEHLYTRNTCNQMPTTFPPTLALSLPSLSHP